MRRLVRQQNSMRQLRDPSGLTMVELLVALTIFAVLSTLTIGTLWNRSLTEPTREAALRIQSVLAGARDRAIEARQLRGVRFLANPKDNRQLVSMVYIGQPTMETQGTVTIRSDGRTLDGLDTNWQRLVERGLLESGLRVQIPRQSGLWYRIEDVIENTLPPSYDPISLVLARTYVDYGLGTTQPLKFALELSPAQLPEPPIALPRNTAVNLPLSDRLPALAGSGIDILFTPRGTVTGRAAYPGLIHLVISSSNDVDLGLPLDADYWRPGRSYATNDFVVPDPRDGFVYQCVSSGMTGSGPPNWPGSEGVTVTDGSARWMAHYVNDNRILTIFTRTGNVSTFSVYEAASGEPADPFRWAETGEYSR